MQKSNDVAVRGDRKVWTRGSEEKTCMKNNPEEGQV